MLKYTDAHNGRSSPSEESMVSGSRPITRTSSNAKWEIGKYYLSVFHVN